MSEEATCMIAGITAIWGRVNTMIERMRDAKNIDQTHLQDAQDSLDTAMSLLIRSVVDHDKANPSA